MFGMLLNTLMVFNVMKQMMVVMMNTMMDTMIDSRINTMMDTTLNMMICTMMALLNTMLITFILMQHIIAKCKWSNNGNKNVPPYSGKLWQRIKFGEFMVDSACFKLNSTNINILLMLSLQDLPNFISPEKHGVQGTFSLPCGKSEENCLASVIVHLIFSFH